MQERQKEFIEQATYSEYFPLLKKDMWARKVCRAQDTHLIWDWMNRSHVEEFWHMAWPEEKISDYLKEVEERENFTAYLAFMGDEPMAYFEVYHPSADPVGETYDIQEGDLGVHVLIGEEKYQRRYIIRLSTIMMRLLFLTHPGTKRLIGEPDVNNKQIKGVMRFLGFQWQADVQLPDKVGALHTLVREDFELAHGSIDDARIEHHKKRQQELLSSSDAMNTQADQVA